MRDDDFDDEPSPLVVEPVVPKTVQVAGVIWIVFGSLILLNWTLSLVLLIALAAAGPSSGGSCFGILIGAAFLSVGIQSIRGTAKGMGGNAIGSLFFGLLNAGGGIVLLFLGLRWGQASMIITGIIAAICLTAGIGLIAAGILALVGRKEYREYRLAQRKAQSRKDAS